MIPAILMEAFPPSADALLADCGQLVTDDMLEQISQADYGMDAEAHLAALRPIRDLVRVPAPMRDEPREALHLVQWSQPDDPTRKAESAGERGHIIRAFACAALLRAASESANHGYFFGDSQTLIQLIDSVLFLGRALPESAASFLTWRVPRLPTHDGERPLFALGLIALALSVSQPAWSSADVDAMVVFVEQAEAAFRDPSGICTPDMFDEAFLTGMPGDLSHASWRALAKRLRAESRHSSALPGATAPTWWSSTRVSRSRRVWRIDHCVKVTSYAAIGAGNR